ncbi:tetratricopeptide repeat protein [bacterium]|nr:tetratricopeptide repeat protein [bacterium]
MDAVVSETMKAEPIPPDSVRSSDRSIQFALIAVLLLGVVLTYLPIFSQQLTTWDDAVYVSTNPYVTSGVTGKGIVWAFTTFDQANYHPLTWLSLMIDAEIFGNRPWGYKLTNLLLHLANTVLVIAIFWRGTGRYWPSLFVGALFAIHPLHVESVAWVSERKDTLSTFFILAAILAYIDFARHRTASKYGTVLGLFVLSLLSKQMYVTLPVLLLLLDYWPLRRMGKTLFQAGTDAGFPPVTPLRAVVEKVPILALSAVASLVIIQLQTKEFSAQHASFSWQERVGNSIVGYVAYIEKTFAPLQLYFFYPYPNDGYDSRTIAVSAAILVTVTVLSLALVRRAPFFFVGWFWYLISLSPVIGIIQVGFQAYADRYTYFPLIGIFLMVVWSIALLPSLYKGQGTVFGAFGVAVILVLGVLSRQQVNTWRDSETLARHALQFDPTNHQANAVLGYAEFSKHRWDEAEQCFALAVASQYAPGTHHLNYGTVLLCQNKLDEASREFEATLKSLPHEPSSKYQLGLFAAADGKYPEAIKLLAEAQKVQPSLLTALALAITHARAGHFDESLDILSKLPHDNQEVRLAHELVQGMKQGNKADELKFNRLFQWPKAVQASRLRGANIEAAVRTGQLTSDQGIKELTTALQLWPYNIDAMLQFAVLLGRSKQDIQAKSQLYRILELDPKHAVVLKLLGRKGPTQNVGP